MTYEESITAEIKAGEDAKRAEGFRLTGWLLGIVSGESKLKDIHYHRAANIMAMVKAEESDDDMAWLYYHGTESILDCVLRGHANYMAEWFYENCLWHTDGAEELKIISDELKASFKRFKDEIAPD